MTYVKELTVILMMTVAVPWEMSLDSAQVALILLHPHTFCAVGNGAPYPPRHLLPSFFPASFLSQCKIFIHKYHCLLFAIPG